MRIVMSGLVGLALVVTLATNAFAQQAPRVRGQIEKVDGSMLTVKARDGQTVMVKLADGARLATLHKITLADIQPNSFIGVAGMPRPDGSLEAFSIHTLPESARANGDGERPWDARPGSTMTNASLGSIVKSKDGDEITVTYKAGEKKVIVTPNTVIAKQMPADKSVLQPGAQIAIMVAEKQPDGSLLAKVMYVGQDVTPAM